MSGRTSVLLASEWFRQPIDASPDAMSSAAVIQREIGYLQVMAKEELESAAQARTRGKDARRDRLKLALRENLKRRKAQARGRDQATRVSAADHETSLYGQVGGHDD